MRRSAVAAFFTAALLSGCGAQAAEDGPSLEEVAAATRADPYRFEHTLEVEGTDMPIAGTGTGAADPESRRGAVLYRFDQGGGTATLEVRRVGGDTYTRFDALGYRSGWSEEGTREADAIFGPFGAFSEPHRAADALARHGRDVESEAGAPIDGVRTIRFRATVPTVELVGGGLTEARRRELEVELRKTRSESAEVEAWAGTDGILRKLAFTVPITEDGDRGRFHSSTRFYDFGRPVEVTPPAEEPCATEAGPHSADAVLAALREGGLAARSRCGRETATILASAEGSDDDAFAACIVERSPQAVESDTGRVVFGNVACHASSEELLRRVRKALEGL